MDSVSIKKFVLLIFIGGFLCGGTLGITLALLVFPLIYDLETVIFITAIVFGLFLPSICLQIWRKKWALVIRRFFFVTIIGLFLSAMFVLEENLLEFNRFDWNVIYICLALGVIPFTLFLILSEFYNESKLYQEIDHVIKGMQIYGLVSKSPDDEEK
jgi:hypothetical protein